MSHSVIEQTGYKTHRESELCCFVVENQYNKEETSSQHKQQMPTLLPAGSKVSGKIKNEN